MAYSEKDRLIELYKKTNTEYYKHLESTDKKGLVDTEGKATFVVDSFLDAGAVLPRCKVGDTVYVLTSDSPSGIEETKVSQIKIKIRENGKVQYKISAPCVYDDWGKSHWTFGASDFGKKLFFDKQQAEQKLKEVKEGALNAPKS